MKSDAHGWREPVGATVCFEHPLDRDCAVNAKFRIIECCEEAVARLFDNPALMLADDGCNRSVMPLTNRMPRVVADARQQ